MTGKPSFDATPSLLGYMQQLRYALWQAIEGAKENILGMVAIEAADDVEIVSPGEHRIEQLKHRDRLSSLSDRSSDLWKTIRIWASLASDQSFNLSGVQFRLITTGTLQPESVAGLLSRKSRNPATALAKLRLIATEDSKTNGKAYEAFRGLPPRTQEQLVRQIEVIPDSPDISEVGLQIQRSLALGFPRQHLATFASHLEGWWFGICIDKLRQPGDNFIHLDQLDAQIHAIRDEFSLGNLPISREIARMNVPPLRYQSHVFVEQLRFIKVNESRINRAITNYLRAFNQRSTWQRENLLLLDELQNYEEALIEEWNIHFDQLQDSLGTSVSEEAKLSAAKSLYSWAEGATAPSIRERCTEPFVVRGSFHILAHQHKIGWHPDFAAKLITLLESRNAAGVH